MGLMRRRALMMATPGGGGGELSDYVQDGLLLHWDGIDPACKDEDGWLDLKDQVLLKFESKTKCYHDVDGVVRTDNGQFIGDFAKVLNTSYASLLPSRTSTIEVVCDLPELETSTGLAYVVMGGGVPVLGKIASGKWAIGDGVAVTMYLCGERKQPMTISANASNCLENGVQLEPSGADYFGAATIYLALGARSGTSDGRLLGKWMSLRFYDRLLTAEEMLKNQKVDNIRFNLGFNL